MHIALAVLVLATIARLSGTVDSDVAWQLWIAQRMQAGADLYRDIVETNPPLWFWMARPVERIASLLQVRTEAVLIITIAAAVALSVAAINQLLHGLSDKNRVLMLSYAALTLFAMPWMHVGQREQIVMIATLPYAALVAARRDSRAVSGVRAAGIGIGAGLGFALKHYFLIVPVLLELWLIAGLRRRWRPIRPETLAITAIGLLYGGAMLIEHDYIELIVPLVGQAYGVFSAPSLLYLFGPFAGVGVGVIALLLANARALSKVPFAAALLIAAIGFAAIYFIQFKGWTYHALPMVAFGCLAMAALLAHSRDRLRVFRVAAPALLCLPFSLSASEAMHPSLPSHDLVQAVAGLPAGTPVGFISEDTALAWSVTLQHKFAYPSRYNGFWMLQAVYANERLVRPDEATSALGRRVVAETVADFRCMPPRRIIAVRSDEGPLPFFLRNPDFADLFGHYRLISRSSLHVYELASPLTPPRDGCIKGH